MGLEPARPGGPGARLRGAALAIALVAPLGTGAAEPAHFVVTERVINPEVLRFGANVERMGNGGDLIWSGSGFEPVVFRTRLAVTGTAPDRIVARPEELAYWDTLRSGALDGARVDLYRIRRGRFEHVRRDRIAEGGFHASGWQVALPNGLLIPPDATGHVHAFDPWNRPGVPYHFALAAVGPDGAVSAPSAAIAVTAPDPMPSERAETGARLVAAPEGAGGSGARAPAPPEGLAARVTREGAVALSWDPPRDGPAIAGYRLLVSDTPPDAHRGYHALLEEGGARAGDLAILHKVFEAPSRARYHTNRVWGAGETRLLQQRLLDFFPDEEPGRSWRLVRHDPGTPVEEPGETYLELELGRGRSARIGGYNHAGTAQDWYPVLVPGREYRIEFWARSERRHQLRFSFHGFHGRPGPAWIRPITFVSRPGDWRKHVATFTPRALQESGELGAMWLEIEGPGRVALDNVRIFRADAPFLDFLPEEYARLAEAEIRTLRTGAFTRTERRTYDLGQYTNPAGVISGTPMQASLPQMLGIIERAGMLPWLQVEPHLAPEEWRGLVEYLAAPHDPAEPDAAPWAAKRAAQGRAAPWTDAFGRIYLEIGNETWNGLFAPWTFPGMEDAETGRRYTSGEVYGLFQEYVAEILRASPHWQGAGLDDKVRFVLGGWPGAEYGRDAAALSPSSDFLSTAAYNGGWELGAGPPRPTPSDYFRLLNDVSQWGLTVARRHAEEAAAIGAARGRPLGLATYEAGPGYSLDGLNEDRVSPEQAAEQERVMKSLAAGTATLDAFLARAALGFTVQNFFAFGEGPYWRSHAPWHRGGHAYPAWALLALFNRVGTGKMLAVETRTVPRTDLPAAGYRAAAEDAPLAAAYATRAGDRLTLAVVSRRVPGYPDAEAGDAVTEVTVELPAARAARITRHRMTGRHDAHNVEAEEVRLLAEPLDPARLADGVFRIPELAPGHAEIYVFEGVSGR